MQIIFKTGVPYDPGIARFDSANGIEFASSAEANGGGNLRKIRRRKDRLQSP
jgi:hypothetical protein